MLGDFSTEKISSHLVDEIKKSIKSVKNFGSVEIYIQDKVVTQITVRKIQKTNRIRRVEKTNRI